MKRESGTLDCRSATRRALPARRSGQTGHGDWEAGGSATVGTIFVRRATNQRMLSLTAALGSPYRMLHRSKETCHAMTALALYAPP